LVAGKGKATVWEAGKGKATVWAAGKGKVTVWEDGKGKATVWAAGKGKATDCEAVKGKATVWAAGKGKTTDCEAVNGKATVWAAGKGKITIWEAGRGIATVGIVGKLGGYSTRLRSWEIDFNSLGSLERYSNSREPNVWVAKGWLVIQSGSLYDGKQQKELQREEYQQFRRMEEGQKHSLGSWEKITTSLRI